MGIVRSGPFWNMIEGRSPLPAVSKLLGLDSRS